MGRRWTYPDLGHYDINGHEIHCFLTITGINGINVVYDKANEFFIVNERNKIIKTGFKTIEEAQYFADPEFTKNPNAKTALPRKTHLMIDYENDIFILRKSNGDIIKEFHDSNIMFNRIKINYPKKEIVIRMTISPF